MPAYKLPPGAEVPSVADFAVGGVMSAPIKGLRSALGAGQALPGARDAVEMIKRLQGGLSKMPTSTRRLAEQTVEQAGEIPPINLPEEIFPTPSLPNKYEGLLKIRSLLGF